VPKPRSEAPGSPGIDPRWARGDKDGVGTAYTPASKIWFTLWNGIITELYSPYVDKPQIRELLLTYSDGATFCHDEIHGMKMEIDRLGNISMGYKITCTENDERFTLVKEIITDHYSPTLLLKIKIIKGKNWNDNIAFYLTLYPHIDGGGSSNHAYVVRRNGYNVLFAEKNSTFLAMRGNIPFPITTVGYVGDSDGHADLLSNMRITKEYDNAASGNVSLTAKVELDSNMEFVLAISFGNSEVSALSSLNQALSVPFEKQEMKFISAWEKKIANLLDLSAYSGDNGLLYKSSYCTIMTHEDKTNYGAITASLSVPWGEVSDDSNRGGYHIVWSRDLFNAATGLLAAGDMETPLKSLIYLEANQLDNGSFQQNFWINGEPYWVGVQLDQTAYPIMLAYRLSKMNALRRFDSTPMIYKAAAFLIATGPVTQQERWEENSGFSTSTIAANITALICASYFARLDNKLGLADFFASFADFLERNLEKWTVTHNGTILSDVQTHYIRINPADFQSECPSEEISGKMISLKNFPPGAENVFPANTIVSTGFLHLVRYGIRRPDDPIILNSIKVIDRVLKTETPLGPIWHRYNHDAYGQTVEGLGYAGTGIGRGWPILTGERGHYELAAGHDPFPYVKALESFGSDTMMIPEQVWDTTDMPEKHLYLGKKTGSATPLVWAHAEYIKLLRSIREGKPFDQVEEVKKRYLEDRSLLLNYEIWKKNRQLKEVSPLIPIRFIFERPFRLLINKDGGFEPTADSINTNIGLYYLDLDPSPYKDSSFSFKISWIDTGQVEDSIFSVSVMIREETLISNAH
jgi:glucoamylase